MQDKFDAAAEADGIDVMVVAAGTQSEGVGGGLLAAKFLEDAHREFCTIPPAERAAVIDNLMAKHEYSKLSKNGYGTPLGISIDLFHKDVFLPFVCVADHK